MFAVLLVSCSKTETTSMESSTTSSTPPITKSETVPIVESMEATQEVYEAADYFPIQSNDISYTVNTGEGPMVISFRGKKNVEGKDVYEVMYGDRSIYFQLMEGNGDLIWVGSASDGETEWADSPSLFLPGELYSGLIFKDAETIYKVVGIEDVTVGGRIFNDCLVIQSISSRVSIFYREYYAKGLGSVKYWPLGDSGQFSEFVAMNEVQDVVQEETPDEPQNPILLEDYQHMQNLTQKRFETLLSVVFDEVLNAEQKRVKLQQLGDEGTFDFEMKMEESYADIMPKYRDLHDFTYQTMNDFGDLWVDAILHYSLVIDDLAPADVLQSSEAEAELRKRAYEMQTAMYSFDEYLPSP
ncbi:hypothetical protein [Paenibacillus odorifer]|uniref:hypothetical protein n=2 Tax=Paenibacillus TaxID=44249 RepID=UPI00117F050B|nr:hypothetical protein [Paenibacillus odorifer]